MSSALLTCFCSSVKFKRKDFLLGLALRNDGRSEFASSPPELSLMFGFVQYFLQSRIVGVEQRNVAEEEFAKDEQTLRFSNKELASFTTRLAIDGVLILGKL